MSRVFAHGALRLYLLKLLAEQPRHGYELIRLVEDHFLGMYTPSAGTIYPRLAALEDDGLIEHDEIDGKKVYRVTDVGRAEIEARREELDELQERAVDSARQIANQIRDDVRTTVKDLRRELRDAMQDVKREERRIARHVRDEVRGRPRSPRPPREREGRERERADRTRDREAERAARQEQRQDARLVLRSLKSDLDAFASDVLAAARQRNLDAERVRRVREALMGARSAVIAALEVPRKGDEPQD